MTPTERDNLKQLLASSDPTNILLAIEIAEGMGAEWECVRAMLIVAHGNRQDYHVHYFPHSGKKMATYQSYMRLQYLYSENLMCAEMIKRDASWGPTYYFCSKDEERCNRASLRAILNHVKRRAIYDKRRKD